MASLENLPADQRAVLQLVLQRGRTYDEIARLLSIDRAAVRARALAAFDALGPQTRVGPERRALITDYLLGQLPRRVTETTRDRLAESASERAWARVLSAELAPIASGPLPDIPMDLSRRDAGDVPQTQPQAAAKPERRLSRSKRGREPKRKREPRKSWRDREPREPKRERKPRKSLRDREPKASWRDRKTRAPKADRERSEGRRISRFGGAVLLAGVAVVVVVVAIALLTQGGGSTPSTTTTTAAARPPTTSTAAATSATSTTAKVISQVNLTPPSGQSKAAGIAEVLRQGATNGVAIVAQHVTPNSTKPPNAYAVWLYNSPGDAHILGFVNPGVGKNGRLSTAGGLPSNASHFKQLIVTLETSGAPKTPGTIILQGKLTGV
jgi:Sigma-70, region 4